MPHLSEEAIVRNAIAQQMRFLARRELLTMELAEYQLVPLKIDGLTGSWPTVFAMPFQKATPPEIISGRLLPEGYNDTYGAADMNLNFFLSQQHDEEWTRFLYRGMTLSNLDELEHILLHGLETSKTTCEAVYVSTVPWYARSYSKLLDGTKIPVFVAMDEDLVADYLTPKRAFSEYFSETDIPAETIAHVFAFLNISGQPAWYRVVLDDEMIFIPLPDMPGIEGK
ncbi:MAG: hypothetical protein IKP06_04110 [Elusimicrobiaceae bacterium]|nr:hypothetical protein [Elusimicrobiaceae bacterium]